jgi:hypothetical protein
MIAERYGSFAVDFTSPTPVQTQKSLVLNRSIDIMATKQSDPDT